MPHPGLKPSQPLPLWAGVDPETGEAARLRLAAGAFGGDTFNRRLDGNRLATLLAGVWGLMRDGRWRTLAEIREGLGRGSEASISARLRDLRKPEFQALFPCAGVERRRRGEPGAGLFEYRLERDTTREADAEGLSKRG